jgi:hypothetical protein
VRYAEPLGVTDHYVAAVVEKVEAELALLPSDAAVAIHLSGHGLSTTTCGDYDCGADAYHGYAARLFARVSAAVKVSVDRAGPTGVFHIYGDGGEGEVDPENEVAGPIEALDARVAEGGWSHVVDIPFEFDSNSRDTLIILRQGYRRPQPDWNAKWESHFPYQHLQVKIANANGGEEHKTDALEAVTVGALDGLLAVPPTSAPPHHVLSSTAVAEEDAPHAADGHAKAPARTTPASDAHTGFNAEHRFDAVGAGATPPAAASGGTGDRAHGADHAAASLAALAGRHAHDGGAGAGVGLLLAIAGGAALAVGAAATRRPFAGRLAAVGLGTQLGGLAWDVVSHAQAGEGVHLLENAGHWTAMIGLGITGTAAILLLRGPRAVVADE